MKNWTWRLYDPCPATKDGHLCEGELGHSGGHLYSVWQVADDGEGYPAYPVYWTEVPA